jgi:hypothetical protein
VTALHPLEERLEMAKGGIEFRDKVIENLRAQLDQANSGIQMMGRIMHNNTVAMQAAWIEWVHGDGAESAMQWIENTLDGPDLIPDEDEPHSRDSQAYFDANKTEPK